MHEREPKSAAQRDLVARYEPKAQRTYTPTHAVLARSAGIYHWTPEGRRLYEFTSGVLVANLGHNPRSWLRSFFEHMGWGDELRSPEANSARETQGQGRSAFCDAVTLTAYNAVTPVEVEATRRLIEL